MAENTLYPQNQYYTLVDSYKSNALDPAQMQELADKAIEIGDKDLGSKINTSYKRYLYNLSDDQLFTKSYIVFLANHTLRTNEKGFDMFYKEVDRVDKILGQQGISKRVATFIIGQQEIYQYIDKDSKLSQEEPNWKEMEDNIIRKYGVKYAQPNIVDAQIYFYFKNKNWSKLIKAKIEKVNRYGLDLSNGKEINDFCFSVIFQHSNDALILKTAIQWMEALNTHGAHRPEEIDTEANLLYKAGLKTEAIAMEKQAVEIDQQYAEKAKIKPDPEFAETVAKMQANLPTWDNLAAIN